MAVRFNILCLITTWTLAGAADWPQWRGPQRDGCSRETGLLKTWPEGGPTLAWKATGIGAGYSGVAIADGRIYTMGEEAVTAQVYALEEGSGKILWAAKLGKAGAPGWGGFTGPRATPTVAGDRLYCLGQYGDLACLDLAGKEIWHKNLVSDLGGKMPEWGYAESPLVNGENVICTPGGPRGCIIALNRQTGEAVWRTSDFTDGAQYASLVLAEIDGQRQYIQLTGASVVGISPAGKVLWHAARKGDTAVITTPIYKDHYVFVTSAYNAGCHLFKVGKTGDAFQAEQVFASKDFDNQHGGVVLLGDYLYGHSDKKGWVCQEFKTGKIVWSEKSKQRKGSVCAAEGLLYLRSENERDSVVRLIEASPNGFIERGHFKQPDLSGKQGIWPHPVIANGKLYLRDQAVLLCYDIKQH